MSTVREAALREARTAHAKSSSIEIVIDTFEEKLWQPIAKFPKDGKPYPVWGEGVDPAFIRRSKGEDIPACYTHWRVELGSPIIPEEPNANAGVRDTILSTLAEFAGSLNEATRDEMANDLTEVIATIIDSDVEERVSDAADETDAELQDDLHAAQTEWREIVESFKRSDLADVRSRLMDLGTRVFNIDVWIPSR